MNDTKIVVDKRFIDEVRMLLIRLAQTESRPATERNQQIETHRQYAEGYLGIKRDKLKSENTANVDDVLDMCGFYT